MDNGFYLVTGTSRGIGEALAERLLADGNTVLGVSRGHSDALKQSRYRHVPADLADPSSVDVIMETAGQIVSGGDFDFLCLVNNASAVEPVGPIDECGGTDIAAHVGIGLVTPMLLSAAFVRRFRDAPVRKKIAFVSSGAAHTPLADESVYCSSKAGLAMFAQCIGLEQADRNNGFEIVSIGPGMVDTAMQQAVRSKTAEEFALADFFKQAYDDGLLQDPREVARKICSILEGRYEQGQLVRVTDL